MYENESPRLIDRREGPHGEVALRRRGDDYEIIANGCFLMDTSDGRSERQLITAALDALKHPEGAHLLIGGLGVGFSLAQAAADPRPARITALEREQAIIDWHTRDPAPLRPFAGTGHADPRTRVVHDDLMHHLLTAGERYDALCLDIDNGPDWTVSEDNLSVYAPAGLAALERSLSENGVLAVWSAARAPDFEARLRERYGRVDRLETPRETDRGEPDVIYLASEHSLSVHQ